MLCLLSPPYQWLKLTDVNTGDAFASTKRTGTGMRFPKVPEDSWRSIRNSRWRSSSRRSTKDWLQWAEAARHAPRSFGCLTFRQGLPLSHSLQATFMMTYCSMACDEWARSKISKAVDHGIPWPYHMVYMDMLFTTFITPAGNSKVGCTSWPLAKHHSSYELKIISLTSYQN